ncbi:MAG: hypothetical protein ACI86C_000590 [Candidatus Latescibacterota bacterium]
MKPATVSQLKKELTYRSSEELEALCLRLARFKLENKELLTYLLFESEDDASYIRAIKAEVDEQLSEINTSSYYFIKKSVRKVLRTVKKYIRYTQNKETEVELLLYFCEQLKDFTPSIKRNITLVNLYERQLLYIEKKINVLHEDLQYDYKIELEELAL